MGLRAVVAIKLLVLLCKVNHFPALFIVVRVVDLYKLLVVREFFPNFACIS